MRTVRRVVGALALLAGLAGCDPTAACTSAGGTCMIGGPSALSCGGTEGPDRSCYPTAVDPGGHWCCVPCPAGQTQVPGQLACH